jgi:hypothetical protein
LSKSIVFDSGQNKGDTQSAPRKPLPARLVSMSTLPM